MLELRTWAAIALGLGCALACNAALVHASRRLVGRCLPEARAAVRMAALGTVLVALIIGVVQLLSVFSAYHAGGALVACALVAALGQLFGRPLPVKADEGRTRVPPLLGTLIRGLVLLGLLPVVWRALAWPPLFWDSLTYHLFFAARFVQNQALVGFAGPYVMDHYVHYPINGEMVASWWLLPFGSDLLVGLMNLPLLLWGGVAVHALARELDAQPEDALLVSVLVCGSPFLFAYVTTQNVDILVFAALTSATLFVVRFLKDGWFGDAILAFAAVGIGVGTKYTALVLGSVLVLVLILASLRQGAWPRITGLLFAGCLLMLVLGGRMYIQNAWETGNPIYPVEGRIGDWQVLEGSPYTGMVIAEKGLGGRTRDWFQIKTVFRYFPDWRIPTSAGPKYLVLIPLAFAGAWWVRDRRRRRLIQLLILAAGLGLLAFYLPTQGFLPLARRWWPGAASRFLPSCFALFAVAAAPIVTAVATRLPLVRYLLLGFVACDLWVANWTLSWRSPVLWGVLGALLLCTLGVAALHHTSRTGGHLVVLSALFLACTIALLGLERERQRTRWHHFRSTSDVQFIPRGYVEGWQAVDELDEPALIALAPGWQFLGQNLFFYPLLGSHLQHRVTYVSLLPDNASHAHAFVTREGYDTVSWEQNLRRAQVDLVFVQEPWSHELEAMEARPRRFRLLSAGSSYRLFQRLDE